LNKPQIKSHLVEVFNKVLGCKLDINFQLDDKHKENHNNFKGIQEKDVGEAIDIFGGEVV